MSPIRSMSNRSALFYYSGCNLGKLELLSQQLFKCEMGENAIKFIDSAIILNLAMHHVKRSFKLNLLVFSMSKVESISYFRRSV
jgi:hypothetical protein